MLQGPRILLLSSDEKEAAILQEALGEHAILTRAVSLPELKAHLEQGEYDALFCSWSFYAGTWNNALEEVRRGCSDLPVIVLSRTAGEQEWVAVLEAGAFDVLVPPYGKPALRAVLEQASASRTHLRNLGALPQKKAV